MADAILEQRMKVLEEAVRELQEAMRARQPAPDMKTTPTTFRLSDLAHGRSGDKGNHANVAVIAYTEAGFAWLREHLTADVVRAYFASLGASRVRSGERR